MDYAKLNEINTAVREIGETPITARMLEIKENTIRQINSICRELERTDHPSYIRLKHLRAELFNQIIKL